MVPGFKNNKFLMREFSGVGEKYRHDFSGASSGTGSGKFVFSKFGFGNTKKRPNPNSINNNINVCFTSKSPSELCFI